MIIYFKDYLTKSRSFFYSTILVFPLIIIYQILLYINFYLKDIYLINGADLLLQAAVDRFGINGIIYNCIGILVVYFFILYIYHNSIEYIEINYSYLLYMIIESSIWASVLYFSLIYFNHYSLVINLIQYNYNQLVLIIGAGIWEELIFRLLLIKFILYILINTTSIKFFARIVLSITISSIIFSLSHYLGAYGDFFTFNSFIYRLIAGLFLGFLYIVRGYGISVYCHVLFDLLLVLYPMYRATN